MNLTKTIKAPSQCELVLQRLRDRSGLWVPMPELHRASGSLAVHSRISDLRRRGYNIEHRNRNASRPDGGRWIHSEYRLVEEVAA